MSEASQPVQAHLLASIDVLLVKASVPMTKSDINKAGKYVSLRIGENCKITCIILSKKSGKLD